MANETGQFITFFANLLIITGVMQTLIKITNNKFPSEVVKEVDPLPGDGQNRPLSLLLPHHVQLEDDLL